MRNVPSLPPPIIAPREPEDIGAASAVRPARKIAQRLNPPVVVVHGQPPANTLPRPEANRRKRADRRGMCRRIEHGSRLPLDTRANTDRRQHARRKEDPPPGIDEEA